MEEMINNRNTQEIKENPAVENKKYLDHHEASLEHEDINAPPLHIPIFQSSPLKTTATDSVPLAISSNRKYMDHTAALQDKDLFVSSLYAPVFQSSPLKTTATDSVSLAISSNRKWMDDEAALQNKDLFVSPLYAPVFQSSPLKTTATDSVLLAISSNRKCMDDEAALQNKDFVSSSYAPVFQSSPLKTTATDSVPLAISSNRKCMDDEAALQNKDFVSSSYAPVFQSEPLNGTPLDLSSLDCKPPLKCKEVREHDDHRDEFDRRETNVHSPTFSLLAPESVSGDSDNKRASAFEKLSELVKSTSGNPESQNNTPLEISKNVTNLHSSKQNKDINKQGICDGDSIENKQLPQDIRRGGITSGYPYLGPAQLPHKLCPFPPSYLGVNANMYPPPIFSTYANSYINPNFIPPLIYANPTPLLPPVACVDISHTNLLTCLRPIYTNISPISHVNHSSLPPVTDIGISRAKSSRAKSSRAKSSRAKSSPVKSSRFSSPPTSTYANSYINPNFVPVLAYANPVPLLPPGVGISHINPPTCLPYIYTNMSRVNPPSSHINSSRFLPPPTYAGTSRTNPAPPLPCTTYSSTSYVNPLSSSSVRTNIPHVKSPSLSSNNCVSISHANSPSHLPPLTDVNTSRVSPAHLSPITCSSTSYVNPLSSFSDRINIPHVKSPSLSSDNYVSTSHANPPPPLPSFIDVDTSRANSSPLPPITCSSTSLSSDNYVSTFHANSPLPLPPFTDVDTSRANSSPLPPVVHYVNISRAKPSPISPSYSDFSPISPPYSDFSPISSPSSLPLVTSADTSRVNSRSSYPAIRISVTPVNPPSSSPSVT